KPPVRPTTSGRRGQGGHETRRGWRRRSGRSADAPSRIGRSGTWLLLAVTGRVFLPRRNLSATLLEMRRRHGIQPLLCQVAARIFHRHPIPVCKTPVCDHPPRSTRPYRGGFCVRLFRYTLPTAPLPATNP